MFRRECPPPPTAVQTSRNNIHRTTQRTPETEAMMSYIDRWVRYFDPMTLLPSAVFCDILDWVRMHSARVLYLDSRWRCFPSSSFLPALEKDIFFFLLKGLYQCLSPASAQYAPIKLTFVKGRAQWEFGCLKSSFKSYSCGSIVKVHQSKWIRAPLADLSPSLEQQIPWGLSVKSHRHSR